MPRVPVSPAAATTAGFATTAARATAGHPTSAAFEQATALLGNERTALAREIAELEARAGAPATGSPEGWCHLLSGVLVPAPLSRRRHFAVAPLLMERSCKPGVSHAWRDAAGSVLARRRMELAFTEPAAHARFRTGKGGC